MKSGFIDKKRVGGKKSSTSTRKSEERMSDKSESFWDNLRKEIKAIGTDTRASDMRRFKAYMIDRVFAMEQGAKIREALLKTQEQKLQAAEGELSNACELIKSLRELAIDLWENDASETDWLDVDRFHELIEKAEQALEKVKRGGE